MAVAGTSGSLFQVVLQSRIVGGRLADSLNGSIRQICPSQIGVEHNSSGVNHSPEAALFAKLDLL